jgi:hypothetical protein
VIRVRSTETNCSSLTLNGQYCQFAATVESQLSMCRLYVHGFLLCKYGIYELGLCSFSMSYLGFGVRVGGARRYG